MDVLAVLTSPVVLLLLVLLFLLVYLYGTRTHGTLERLGIPVIKPYPFIGSYLRPWKVVAVDEDLKNARRFGRAWGVYDGPKPHVFIGDIELAKQIFIKDFEHFSDRPRDLFDFEYGRDQMDLLPADRWKPLRTLLAPPLRAAGQLKQMMPTMLQCCEDGFRRLDAQLQRSRLVDLKRDVFGPITLDIMSQFSFGMKFPDIADKDSKFVRSASAFASPSTAPDTWMTLLLTSFPSINSYFAGLEIIPAMRYFIGVLQRTMKDRRQAGIRREDLVDILMDAIDKKVPTAEYRRLNLNENLIVLQGAEMLMAAYDTIGTALTGTAYHLTVNPDIQEHVRREAADVLADGPLTYDTLQKLPLLEGCVHEALRLTPLLHRHFRVCTRDWEYDGLRIPVGTEVVIPVTPFHRDATAFPEPDRFLPDRWLAEDARHLTQYHNMPFGLGPHACIGSRLGLMECKYVLALMLQRYRLVRAPETKLEYLPGMGIFCSTAPILANIEKI